MVVKKYLKSTMKVLEKYKEIVLYLIFGGFTFLISVCTFAVFNVLYGINELLANMLSWIIAVAFAYFTNRKWVFSARVNSLQESVKQMFFFFLGRVTTLVFEEIVLYAFITRLNLSSIVVKVIAQIMVIILNYVISKIFVFKEEEANSDKR